MGQKRLEPKWRWDPNLQHVCGSTTGGSCCAPGFRHSAGFHARVVLDGAACRRGGLGEDDDVLGVLGVDRGVPIVVRVLVSW